MILMLVVYCCLASHVRRPKIYRPVDLDFEMDDDKMMLDAELASVASSTKEKLLVAVS